ncbi:MAG: RING finger domain-containing protein [Promethearchaeota archaeon]
MVKCIICHMEIMNEFDILQECPNGHPTHEECLKEWLLHSNKCPLCSEPYSRELINKFSSYIKQKEKEKEVELNNQLKKETLQKIEDIAEKIVFFKFTEHIEKLIEQKQYELALERLDAYDENNFELYKKRRILFLRGKINYLRGRYDLAINLLFKLVKDKFDYPEGFLYLGKSYEQLGLYDKAKWAFERVK